MVATQNGNLIDLALYDQMPLAVGVGGHVSAGSSEFIISNCISNTHSAPLNAIEKRPQGPMRSALFCEFVRRAKAGYLLNATKNIQILLNEINVEDLPRFSSGLK